MSFEVQCFWKWNCRRITRYVIIDPHVWKNKDVLERVTESINYSKLCNNLASFWGNGSVMQNIECGKTFFFSIPNLIAVYVWNCFDLGLLKLFTITIIISTQAHYSIIFIKVIAKEF